MILERSSSEHSVRARICGWFVCALSTEEEGENAVQMVPLEGDDSMPVLFLQEGDSVETLSLVEVACSLVSWIGL